mgnify:CR=1 FL=1
MPEKTKPAGGNGGRLTGGSTGTSTPHPHPNTSQGRCQVRRPGARPAKAQTTRAGGVGNRRRALAHGHLRRQAVTD